MGAMKRGEAFYYHFFVCVSDSVVTPHVPYHLRSVYSISSKFVIICFIVESSIAVFHLMINWPNFHP